MKKLTPSQIAKALATGLVLTTLTVSTNVSAAGSQIIKDATRDYDNTRSVSNDNSTYSEPSQTPTTLDKSKYDYQPPRTDLEDAETAAFPGALKASD